MKKSVVSLTLALALFSTVVATAQNQDDRGDFRLSSTTFRNGGRLPLSMALGSNHCPFVTGGGDTSPELSWTNAPVETQSFVVTMFDVTASFTHWGMYNISPDMRQLPQNAGIAGSTFGQQVFNDFSLGA